VIEAPQRLNLWQLLHSTRVQWHGVKLNQPDTSYNSHSLALTVWGHWAVFHLIFNAYWEPLTFETPGLPSMQHSSWRRIIDTSLDSPLDFCAFPEAPDVSGQLYRVEPRSVVMLACRRTDDED
jgi:isoamylase